MNFERAAANSQVQNAISRIFHAAKPKNDFLILYE